MEFDTALLTPKVTLIGTGISIVVALLGRLVCWRSIIRSTGVVVIVIRIVVAIRLHGRLVLTLGGVRLALMSPASHAVWLETLTLTTTCTETSAVLLDGTWRSWMRKCSREDQEEYKSGCNNSGEEDPAPVGRKGTVVAVVVIVVAVAAEEKILLVSRSGRIVDYV